MASVTLNELASWGVRQNAGTAIRIPTRSVPELFPYGIYTIPEISMVGHTEEELTQQGVPYEVGKAHYREIARGQIIGDSSGLLKLIFHLETRQLLSVHIIGEGASELIHIGQAVMALAGASTTLSRPCSITPPWRSATRPPPLTGSTVSVCSPRRVEEEEKGVGNGLRPFPTPFYLIYHTKQ